MKKTYNKSHHLEQLEIYLRQYQIHQEAETMEDDPKMNSPAMIQRWWSWKRKKKLN